MRGHRGKQRGAEQARHHLADLHAFASRTYSSTFFASTSSGTLPPLTTMSLKSRRSYLAPSAFCASPRWRTISLCPTLRSEEHTSELQSLMRISYAVFCLKKKKTTHNTQSSLT